MSHENIKSFSSMNIFERSAETNRDDGMGPALCWLAGSPTGCSPGEKVEFGICDD